MEIVETKLLVVYWREIFGHVILTKTIGMCVYKNINIYLNGMILMILNDFKDLSFGKSYL